jgi:pimeloyl-ACP methyl ester carboxylesterase
MSVVGQRHRYRETVMLPGVGHTPQLEAPDNVIAAVRDWLGRTISGTR